MYIVLVNPGANTVLKHLKQGNLFFLFPDVNTLKRENESGKPKPRSIET